MADSREEELRSKFESQRESLGSFKEKVSGLIKELVESKDIAISSLESRVKNVNSFLDKTTRPGKSYGNPLKEITDLVGVRLIVYYPEDIEKVCEVIRSEFDVDNRNSVNKSQELRTDQFGYRSVHLIVRLNDSRKALVEWQSFRDLCVEIQVRTILQHAWAQIEHELNYKATENLPSPIRRRLYGLAGLLEIADREFSQIQSEVRRFQKVSLACKGEFESGEFDREITRETLNVFLDHSEALKSLLSSQTHFSIRSKPHNPDDEESLVETTLLLLSTWGVKIYADLEALISDCLSNANLIDFLQNWFKAPKSLYTNIELLNAISMFHLLVSEYTGEDESEMLRTFFDRAEENLNSL